MFPDARAVRLDSLRTWAAPYGDLASVVGVVVSTLGFGVAIWQIRRTATAALAARDAAARAQRVVRDALDRLGARFLGSSVAVALGLLRELQHDCRYDLRNEGIERCRQIVRQLAAIMDDHHLEVSEREAITRSMNDMQILRRKFERRTEARVISQGNIDAVEELMIFLTRLDARLTRQLMEDRSYGQSQV
jgi:hypothetical protein